MASSLRLIKKKFTTTTNSTKEYKLCHICKRELINKRCPSDSCITHNYASRVNISKSIKVETDDIHTQIHTVLQSNLEIIKRYRSINIKILNLHF